MRKRHLFYLFHVIGYEQESRKYWELVQSAAARCFEGGVGVEECAEGALGRLPAPFNRWGDPERMLVSFVVIMLVSFIVIMLVRLMFAPLEVVCPKACLSDNMT
jgi:hypothetical protein